MLASGESPLPMANINRLLSAVEKSQSEIGVVKDRLEDVIKRMDVLQDDLVKNVESTGLVQGGKEHSVTLNSGIVETALDKISQDMSKFKAMVRDAASAQEEKRHQVCSTHILRCTSFLVSREVF
ncbi:hypothetical protein FOZ60_015141 [Perkinsus olseni]|uniref:Uncharacterized protein n=1 Tax=Perkinsus olseni TaxID=32597 RepID=A0A7J6N657_PEROL|nr:hypothetical protein FOZ60_015141 [Perkinsus olseni]